MSELSGINSAKYFAQNTVYRTVVRRSGLLSNKSQQLCLTTQALGFLNPQNMELVHMYKWNLVTSVKLEPKQDEFSIYIIKKKKQEKVTFTAPNRSQILCKIIKVKHLSQKQRDTGYEVTKFKYNGAQKEYNVYLRGYGLVLEHRTTLQECSEFLYSDMKEVITISDTFGGFALILKNGNIHAFISSHLQAILTAILGGCSQVGVQLNKRACLQDEINTMMLDIANTEQMFMNLAEFKVKKRNERRHTNPVDRVLTISEKWFVERDARTYSIIKLLSLSTLCYICRPSDDPQAVVVTFLENEEYRSFEYITTIRDQLISTLYDCTVSLNKDVIISEIPLFASLTIRTPAIQDQVDLEGQLVRNLSQFNPEYPQKENFNVKEYFMMQVFLFNANIPTTLKYTDNNRQFKDVARAIEKLLTYAVPSEQFLRCLSCLLTVKSGYEFFADNQQFREKIIGIICSGLTSAKEMIIFHSLTLMSTILSPRFEEPTTVEKFNKKQLLENDVVVECLFSVLLKNLQQMDTLFVMNCVSVIVLIICDPFSETTDLNQFIVALNRMLDLGRDLFKLFHQSQCLSVIHTAGKIMKTIVEEGRDIEERIQKIQIAALVEGATLQQLHTSLFMIPKTKQQALYKNISILLLDLWTTGNKESTELLNRIIPPALLRFLDSTEQAPEEELQLEPDAVKKDGVPLSLASHFWKNWNAFSRPKHKHDNIRTRHKKELTSKKNWKLLLYQIKKDHQNVALIWNHHTREELKECINAEIRVFQEQQQLSHDGYVSWNHQEFIVPYRCLDKEICVGSYYLRLLLNPVEQEELPKINEPLEFFDKLFHRSLFETNIELQVLSVQAMTVMVKDYSKEIGTFDDIGHIVKMLKITTSKLLRDRLIELIHELIKNEHNARLFIDCDGISLFVDLMTLSQLTCDHMIIPIQTNLITNGVSTEGEWYYSVVVTLDDQTTKKTKKGPVGINDLKNLYESGLVTRETLIWCQGMEDWKPLNHIVQLHWTILSEGHGVLSDIELTLSCLSILIELVKLYPTRDGDGGIIRPLPRPKRLLSNSYFLPHVVQCILTFQPQIVERSARLLYLLLEDNMAVQPKFYLYGIFYFVLMYPGSNIIPLCQLLKETHRHQKVSDAVELSVLNTMLPSALINALDRSNPSDFASILLGENETPEIIWNSDMRKFLIDTINQHIGNFPDRLSVNPKAVYSYVPIAPIVYEQLEEELYCSRYYLRHFCDTTRYPNWPVEDPVEMLQDILKAWVKEAEKKQEVMTFAEACKTLRIEEPQDGQLVDPSVLRRAYYKLAAKYHPDKNPEGREIFEQVNEAYNFIVEHKGKNDTTREKISLLIQAQVILYKYYADDLSPYKYAGYPLLLVEAERALNAYDKEALCTITELTWLTLQASSLNVEEIRRVGGLALLAKILDKTVSLLHQDVPPTSAEVLCTHCLLKAFAVAAQFDECRVVIKKISGVLSNLTRCISFGTLPKVLEGALDCVSCFSLDPELQSQMFNENYVILIVPHLFRFDYTLSGSGIDASSDTNQQVVYNSIACATLVALRRLCGLSGECPNDSFASCLDALLTVAITRQMDQTTPHELLQQLNSNVETPTVIWNSTCRTELLKYCDLHQQRIPEWQPLDIAQFVHLNLQHELYVAGVYVRIFNEQILTQPQVEIKQLLIGLCETATHFSLHQNIPVFKDSTPEYASEVLTEWYRQLAEAITNILQRYDQMDEFLSSRRLNTLEDLFKFFEHPDKIVCQNMLKSVELLSRNTTCLQAISEPSLLCHFFQLVYAQPTLYSSYFVALNSLLSNTANILNAISLGGLLYLLDLFTSPTQRGDDIKPRILASATIAKMASSPVQGPRVAIIVNKLLPQAFLAAMRTDPESAVKIYEASSESPELIWTASMRTTLRGFISKMTAAFHSKQRKENTTRWSVPDKFVMTYEETKGLLVVGGIYLDLFIKQPNWPLRDQNEFSDALLSKFIDFRTAARRGKNVDKSVLKKISDAAAGLYTNHPEVLDHVAKAGHLAKIVEITNEDGEFCREEIVILQVVGVHKRCCEKLSEYSTMEALSRAITKSGKDLPIVADAFKNIVEHSECTQTFCLVSQLLQQGIIEEFMKVLEGVYDKILKDESSETKARFVEGLQQACTDELHGESLVERLDQFPVWLEYSRQKHSLFLTSGPTVAGYIAGPTAQASVGLISDVAHNSASRPDKPPELD